MSAAYWAFTLTDGALRMLVLLHLHGERGGPTSRTLRSGVLYQRSGITASLWGAVGLAAVAGLAALLLPPVAAPAASWAGAAGDD